MSHTFEELVSREIDGLYHGALFLNGGDPDEAEHLLMQAMGSAFHDFDEVGTAGGGQQWLEERLARTFVASRLESESSSSAATTSGAPASPASSSDALYTAARDVPHLARVALWLVLLQRWPHARARETLRIDEGELRALLRYRHALVAQLWSDGRSRDGKDRHVVT